MKNARHREAPGVFRGESQPALAGECDLISASTKFECSFGSTLAQCFTTLPSGPIRKVWRLASLVTPALNNTPYFSDTSRVGSARMLNGRVCSFANFLCEA